MDNIPLSYNPVGIASLNQVLQRYAELSHTNMVDDFEKDIARITGAKYVVALNSGTASIHLGLKALNVKEDDEVIVSTFTYVGSVNPILYLGAKPIFIDSEFRTGNMDPFLLEEAIQDSIQRKKKPKAVIVVHSYGMPAQMDEILAITKRYDIPVLEDAAEALGSRYRGRQLGTIGEVGILSFNNNKILTTYGGGALLTNNEKIYQNVKYWASQAREDKPYYEFKEVGFSNKMGSVNASAGLAALSVYPNQIEASRAKYDLYENAFRNTEGISFIAEPEGYFSNHWLSTILLDFKSNTALATFLKQNGVETRLLWNPMHQQPVFKSFRSFTNGTSDKLFNIGLCLPSSFNLSIAEQTKVIDSIRTYLNEE